MIKTFQQDYNRREPNRYNGNFSNRFNNFVTEYTQIYFPKIISEKRDLLEITKQIEASKIAFFSIEFKNEYEYNKDLSTISFWVNGSCYIVDFIDSEIGISDISSILFNENIVKVCFGLENLIYFCFQSFNKVPNNIYDLNIAVMFAGYSKHCSKSEILSHFVKNFSNHKHLSKYGMGRRPLSAQCIDYSCNEVMYLEACYKMVSLAVKSAKNDQRFEEETKIAIKNVVDKFYSDVSWKKIKFNTTDVDFLKRARALFDWKEMQSRFQNVSQDFLMKDYTIAEIAEKNPSSISELKHQVKSINQKLKPSQLISILNALKSSPSVDESTLSCNAQDLPDSYLPVADMLKILLRVKASDFSISHFIICDSRDLALIALHGKNAKVECLSGWRDEVFGKDAIKMINGEVCLVCNNGEFVLKNV